MTLETCISNARNWSPASGGEGRSRRRMVDENTFPANGMYKTVEMRQGNPRVEASPSRKWAGRDIDGAEWWIRHIPRDKDDVAYCDHDVEGDEGGKAVSEVPGVELVRSVLLKGVFVPLPELGHSCLIHGTPRVRPRQGRVRRRYISVAREPEEGAVGPPRVSGGV